MFVAAEENTVEKTGKRKWERGKRKGERKGKNWRGGSGMII